MIFIIKLGTILLNIIYAFIKLIPTRRKVVMMSRQSNDPSFEFLMVRDELRRRCPGIEVVMLCRTLDGGVSSTLLSKASYFLHMFVQMVHIASSQVVILDTYCIVISLLRHKKSLTVIQMWHSMGTMKKFGYTALDTAEGSRHELAYAMKMHQNYDYIFDSAEAYKRDLARGFHCDIRKIVTMPLPRLDLLKYRQYEEMIRKRIFQKCPELHKKPVILYCPTFRKQEAEFGKAVDALIRAADLEKYNLVIKLHPLSKTVVSGKAVTADEFSSFDMLFIADYMISDYSCIIYEAAVRDIPLFFYNFDMELYTDGRGLAIDYEKELPGAASGNAQELLGELEKPYDMKRLQSFAEKYVHPTDHATEDIAAFVLKYLK